MSSITLFVFGILFMLSVTLPAQIIVSKDGAGSFKTISEALKSAKEYDKIIVKTGKYTESITMDNRKQLTLTAEGNVSVSSLSLVNCYRVYFQGFRFESSTRLTKCEDIVLSGSEFQNVNSAVNIDGSLGVKLYGNWFRNGKGTVISVKDSRQTRMINNIIHHNAGETAIMLTASDAEIKNNTIVYNSLQPVSIGKSCEVKLWNNIIAFNTIPSGAGPVTSHVEARVKSIRNCLHQNGNTKQLISSDDISSDPKFVDGPNGNFEVKTDSPCYGAASDGTNRFAVPILGLNIGADVRAKGDPIEFEATYDEAIDQMKRRKYTESSQILKRLLQTYPKNSDAWTALSSVCLSLIKYGDAAVAATNALKYNPKNTIAQLNLAKAWCKNGKSKEAFIVLDEAVGNGADEAEVESVRGDCYVASRNFSSAITSYQYALKLLYSDDPIICLKLACVYNLQAKTDEALAWLDKALHYGVDTRLVIEDNNLSSLKSTQGYKKLKEKYGFE